MLGTGAPDQGIVQLCYHAVMDLPAKMLKQSASSVAGENDGISKVWLGTYLLCVHSYLHISAHRLFQLACNPNQHMTSVQHGKP